MAKTICFCGSFKFHKQMEKEAESLRKKGFQVIVPKPSHIRHGHKPEELREGKYSKRILKKWEGEGAFEHLENIRKSDIIYIFNRGSYIGPAVTVEIGYALALGKKIYSKARIKDITVSNFISEILSPSKLAEKLKKDKK